MNIAHYDDIILNHIFFLFFIKHRVSVHTYLCKHLSSPLALREGRYQYAWTADTCRFSARVSSVRRYVREAACLHNDVRYIYTSYISGRSLCMSIARVSFLPSACTRWGWVHYSRYCVQYKQYHKTIRCYRRCVSRTLKTYAENNWHVWLIDASCERSINRRSINRTRRHFFYY